MGEVADLYDQDFIAWTEQQARVLREAAASRSNLSLDWENLIEEVEDLGRSHYHAVASQIGRIVQHLLKLEFSPADEPRAGWRKTVIEARSEIERWLESDPGLKPRLADMLVREAPRATKLAAQVMRAYGEEQDALLAFLRGGDSYSLEQVRGEWWPARNSGRLEQQ